MGKKNKKKATQNQSSQSSLADNNHLNNNNETNEKIKKYSVNELVSKAEDLMVQYEPEAAQKFFLRALELEPNNSDVLEKYAFLLIEYMDDFEKAKELLLKSVNISPDSSYTKYLQLGQLESGRQSFQYFSKGVELMMKAKQGLPPNDPGVQELNSQISSALCAQAEIYMTDECFAEEAQGECERLLQQAIQLDSNPETLQTYANFKMCEGNNEQALTLLQASLDAWKNLDFEDKPEFEFRHTTAKMFLELEQFETAANLWEELLEEDDTIAEVYYFLGLAYRNLDPQAALEVVIKAKELLLKTKEVEARHLEEVEELLAELQQTVQTMGNNSGSDSDEMDTK